MTPFGPLRTARLDVRFRELDFFAEMVLCQIPEALHERALTEFLEASIDPTKVSESPNHVTNPRLWTVQERMLGLAHYNLHVRPDAPNYSVTEASRLMDYLDNTLVPAEPSTFLVGDSPMFLGPLLGAMAETIEMLHGEVLDEKGRVLSGRVHWMIGMMAARCLHEGETHPCPVEATSAYEDWLKHRMLQVAKLSSSRHAELYKQFGIANEKDVQFFRIWFDDLGIIALPRLSGDAKEAAGVIPAARFLIHSALGELALSLSGKS